MTINEMVLQSQRGNGEVLAELCEKFQGMFFRAAEILRQDLDAKTEAAVLRRLFWQKAWNRAALGRK